MIVIIGSLRNELEEAQYFDAMSKMRCNNLWNNMLELRIYEVVDMVRKGHGKKNGSQAGIKSGGFGRNQTAKCRHSTVKKSRK